MARVKSISTRKRPFRKVSRKAARLKRAAASVRRTPLRNLIRSVVKSMTEDKQAFYSEQNIKYNSGIDSNGDIRVLIPSISAGVGEAQRIGDTVNAKSLTFRGHIRLDPNETIDSTKLPQVAARMFVLSMKNKTNYNDVINAGGQLATLLRKGNTTTGFTGSISDLYAPVNTEVFTVHHQKVFYLNQSYINTPGPSSTNVTIAQDMKNCIKFFNIKIKCKSKKLRFDEDISSNIFPVNFCPFVVIGYTYLDGSSPDVVDTKLAMSFDTSFVYEDL